LATKWALCLTTKSSALIWAWRSICNSIVYDKVERGVNIQVLLSCKDQNSKSMTFFQCLWIFTIQTFHKRIQGSSTSIEKTHERFTYFSIIVGVLTLTKEFFHLPHLIRDLEPFVFIQKPTLKPLFPGWSFLIHER
jgi:hypothetical protein